MNKTRPIGAALRRAIIRFRGAWGTGAGRAREAQRSRRRPKWDFDPRRRTQ